MKSYKENWKKLIGIGVVALAALLVLIGIGMIYHEKVKKDAGVEKKDRTDYQYHVAIISENPTDSFWKKIYQDSFCPSAIRICSLIKSIPVTHSVTGCST